MCLFVGFFGVVLLFLVFIYSFSGGWYSNILMLFVLCGKIFICNGGSVVIVEILGMRGRRGYWGLRLEI